MNIISTLIYSIEMSLDTTIKLDVRNGKIFEYEGYYPCVDIFECDKTEILGVEAEQLMTIFIYIISKARIKDILIHCKLIQLFTTSMTKSSMIGYYYSNAEASVKYIQNLKNIKELLKGNIDVFSENNDDY